MFELKEIYRDFTRYDADLTVLRWGTVNVNPPQDGQGARLDHDARSEFLSEDFFSAKSNADLSEMMQLIIAEQQKRAIEGSEPDALLEQGFKDGFKPNGLPHDPWIVDGVLICPGAVNERGSTSHDCGFVAFDDHWCWEHPDVLLDDVRYIDGPKHRQRSVSLIPVHEGLEFDLVISSIGRSTKCDPPRRSEL